jgi:hypothetical protein
MRRPGPTCWRSSTTAPTHAPLAGISQCHLGIISQLQAFAELPALQAAAAQSRSVMTHTLTLFQYAVWHHADEENALFPAVLRSAAQ